MEDLRTELELLKHHERFEASGLIQRAISTVPISRRPEIFLAMGTLSTSPKSPELTLASLALLYRAAPNDLRTKFIPIGETVGLEDSGLVTAAPRPGFSELDVRSIVDSVDQLGSLGLRDFSSEFGYIPL